MYFFIEILSQIACKYYFLLRFLVWLSYPYSIHNCCFESFNCLIPWFCFVFLSFYSCIIIHLCLLFNIIKISNYKFTSRIGIISHEICSTYLHSDVCFIKQSSNENSFKSSTKNSNNLTIHIKHNQIVYNLEKNDPEGIATIISTQIMDTIKRLTQTRTRWKPRRDSITRSISKKCTSIQNGNRSQETEISLSQAGDKQTASPYNSTRSPPIEPFHRFLITIFGTASFDFHHARAEDWQFERDNHLNI